MIASFKYILIEAQNYSYQLMMFLSHLKKTIHSETIETGLHIKGLVHCLEAPFSSMFIMVDKKTHITILRADDFGCKRIVSIQRKNTQWLKFEILRTQDFLTATFFLTCHVYALQYLCSFLK